MTDLHIRIPDDLAEKIKAESEKNFRSLNGEIVYILTDALSHADALSHGYNGFVEKSVKRDAYLLAIREPVREQTQAVKRGEPPE